MLIHVNTCQYMLIHVDTCQYMLILNMTKPCCSFTWAFVSLKLATPFMCFGTVFESIAKNIAVDVRNEMFAPKKALMEGYFEHFTRWSPDFGGCHLWCPVVFHCQGGWGCFCRELELIYDR